jgi:predicted transposase/invertase (TIGR01784 family)
MDYNKVEDSVFKKAMEVFKEGAAEFFGLDVKIIAPAETEIKNIDIRTNAMDYLFYTDEDQYLHFEFQTTKKKEDLSRFLYYDASLYYKSEKKITTVVVYSSDIKDVVINLDCGSIKYNIKSFYMSNFDGDSKLKDIKQKVENNIELTDQDIMTLSFIPLMTSKKSKSDITLESIELAQNMHNNKEKNNCLMLLYALFDKFGDDISKKKFKEAVGMTDVGKMIYEEGMEEGIEKGIEKGKVDLLIKLLIKKFKIVPEEYKKQLMTLPQVTIEIIGTEIFEMESIEELKKYFN